MFDNKDQEHDYIELIDLMREEAGVAPCEQWPDAFHPTLGDVEAIRAARALCGECPIKAQCAQYGIKWENQGIYGGLTGFDRAVIRNKLRSSGVSIRAGLLTRKG